MILWIKEFLKDRPVHVLVNGSKSNDTVLNIGVPQGCVPSPFLVSNEMTCNGNGLTLLKHADDMAPVACLTDEDSLTTYRQCVNTMALWFKNSALELYIPKTISPPPLVSAAPIRQPFRSTSSRKENMQELVFFIRLIRNFAICRTSGIMTCTVERHVMRPLFGFFSCFLFTGRVSKQGPKSLANKAPNVHPNLPFLPAFRTVVALLLPSLKEMRAIIFGYTVLVLRSVKINS